MSRFAFVLIAGLWLGGSAHAAQVSSPVLIAPGVWRIRVGSPEAITPQSTRHYAPAAEGMKQLPAADQAPIPVKGSISARGALIELPLAPGELIYGLGLQLQSFQQRGSKKRLRVNADPAVDTGDTHAPVPFYVTTHGYGVFVDTARYATFYLGNATELPPASLSADGQRNANRRSATGTSTNDGWNGAPAYEQKGIGKSSHVFVEVPEAQGVDVYLFAGPSMREAVQRYNLYSGGGPLPPRWGLGFWYRAQSDYGQQDVIALAKEFRERNIPCDVLGLEPHWQRHSYSSSYLWGKLFPEPKAMIDQLTALHYRLNLWEQAYVDPSSPIYAALRPYSGSFQVWGGLVPDFLSPQARRIFGDIQEKEHVALGVSGYKADECDNSDFTGNWSFPEISTFPSGADGEQMHMLLGLRYQDALQGVFDRRQQRTYGLVRSSGALAAPYPYVLYSDLYDHRQFIHGIAQASFSGLLWTPEVREAASGPGELVRRLQAVAFSPVAMINAWYLRNPPWKQVDRAANNAGHLAADWESAEAACRAVIDLRMRLIPYLQAAFVRYHREGLPPFRAVVLDYPSDPKTRDLDDEYLVGDDLLVAPVIVPSVFKGPGAPTPAPYPLSRTAQRSVYLPAGEWYDYWTGKSIKGAQRFSVDVPIDRIPLYVKSGAILPLAQPTLNTEDPASWKLTAKVYGDGSRGAHLFEDDGSYRPVLPSVGLEWDPGTKTGHWVGPGSAPETSSLHYSVARWVEVNVEHP